MPTPSKSSYNRKGAKVSQAAGRAVYQMEGGKDQKATAKSDYARRANSDVRTSVPVGDSQNRKPAAAQKGHYVRKGSSLVARAVPLLRQRLSK